MSSKATVKFASDGQLWFITVQLPWMVHNLDTHSLKIPMIYMEAVLTSCWILLMCMEFFWLLRGDIPTHKV